MTKPVVSSRAAAMPFSPIRKLKRYADEAKERGVNILRLNIGESDIPSPPIFFRQLRKVCRTVVGYSPSAGYRDIVEAWQRYYRDFGIRLSSDEIIVTTGGSEAILFALMAVADTKDEVIVFEPLYPNYISFARMAGVRLRPVLLTESDGYHLPPESVISKVITKRTKAILFCNPANPTGTVFTEREQRLIARLALRHNLFIITDETYREIVYSRKVSKSFMQFANIRDRVVLVDSVSKRFNVCGTRIGCLATRNKAVYIAALKCAQGRLSAPTLEQLAVVPLLLNHRRFVETLRRENEQRRRAILNGLSRIAGARYSSPEGAVYMMVELPIDDSEDFCRWMLQKYSFRNETVMLAPGSGFYLTPGKGKQQVRLAFSLNCSLLARAMNILARAVPEYQKNI